MLKIDIILYQYIINALFRNSSSFLFTKFYIIRDKFVGLCLVACRIEFDHSINKVVITYLDFAKTRLHKALYNKSYKHI